MDIKLRDISEQLQENILTYFDGYELPDNVLDDLCNIVHKTISERS